MKRLISLILVFVLALGLIPAAAMAAETGNQAPVLMEGVAASREDSTVTNYAYILEQLQSGQIFEDPDGDAISYCYERSADGGGTWSEKQGFDEALHGSTTLQLTEPEPGAYLYRFYAYDGTDYSSDTWTLTLTVTENAAYNFSFYVGRDQNYKSGSNTNYPVITLYKTAGIDPETFFDYVGWFRKGDETVYIFEPADYAISGSESQGWKVTVDGVLYELHDYQPMAFTNSRFGAEGTDAVESGTLVSNYNMFYATLESGRYSYRAYGYNTATGSHDVKLGGMSLDLPTDTNVDGETGGGTEIYLRLLSLYTKSKTTVGTYFTADDFDAEVNVPIMGVHAQHGAPYQSGSYTYYPFMAYAAGNAAVMTYTLYPTLSGYVYSHKSNATLTAGYTVSSVEMPISQELALTVTVPETAEFGLYYQWNNFNTEKQEPAGMTANADGTKTYTYHVASGSGNYTWRLTDPEGVYVTKAGWMPALSQDTALSAAFQAGDAADRKLHDTSGLGSTVGSRDEQDIQVNLDPSGFASTEYARVRAYRLWEIINSDTGNIMIEPDFRYEVLMGSEGDVEAVNGGNASGNWLDVTPTGTDIIALTYDAIHVSPDDHGTHGGLYPAVDPQRTGVFVITNEPAGNADADINFNTPDAYSSTRPEEWDYNFDTWFYMDTDSAPTLDFTVVDATGSVAVSYAIVTTDAGLNSTLSDWTDILADTDGSYSASLQGFRDAGTLGGTVIIKMTDDSGTSYRLVRVAQMHVETTNVSNPGEPIMPGDDVAVSFSGLYRSVNKIAGIFNPTTYYVRYTTGGTEVNGSLAQYQKLDNAAITLTIPEDLEFAEGENTAEYCFTNGYVYGSMYAAANPFAFLYTMTDAGAGTNFNAVNVSYALHRLADIPVAVSRKVTYDLKLNVTDSEHALTGYTLTFTDSDGQTLSADASGIYRGLGYGSYTYSVQLDGYVCKTGSLKLGSADGASVADGILSRDIILVKAAENAWDGVSLSEPSAVDGVYRIGTGGELAWFAAQVNGGNTAISAVLTADIDLAGYNWTPIGGSSNKFAGSFDGQGFRIYHLAIDYSADSAAAPYLGLFGCVSGSSSANASIKNMTLEGAVTATSTASVSNAYIGGLAGSIAYANIENVITKVDVTIRRVKGNWASVGGIAGQIANSSVTDCGNEGDISGYQYVGGITGKLSGTATGCYNTGSISGSGYVAGLAASNTATVSSSYNTGSVTASATNSYAGGLVGIHSGASAVIDNCFTTGTVTGGTSYVGGAIGRVNNAAGTVSNVWYLDTAFASGIGAVAGSQTASVVSAETLSSAAFVVTMNAGLEAESFKAGTGHPVLVWQTVEEESMASFGEPLHNLSLQDLIKIGYAFTIDAPDATERGVVIVTGDSYTEGMDITVDTENAQVKALTASGSYWTTQTDGIYSQRLDTVHYARPYVVIDGEYIYGDVDEYSVPEYAATVFAQDGKEELKQCMVDLLNYGAAAQVYLAELNGTDVPDTLINDMLSDEQKVIGWNGDLKQYAPTLTKDTAGDLDAAWSGSNLSLLEAICLNLASTGDVDGMYYWTAEDYEAAEVLDSTTASGILTVKASGSYSIGTISGIAAKNIADVCYVCAYNDVGACGPVRADSVAIYATKLVDSKADGSAASNTAKALLVYGASAKVYLESLNGG